MTTNSFPLPLPMENHTTAHAPSSLEPASESLLRERAFNMRWAQEPLGVIPLTAADPDFLACQAIRDRLNAYVADGLFSYAPAEGLPAFRGAVAEWFTQHRGIACDAGDVLAMDSAASALACIARANLRPGDEAFIPDPVDFLFQHTISRVGALPVRIAVTPTTTAGQFIEQMQARLTPRTRMLWLCNPHNPLGVVYPRAWLSEVAGWAVQHGLRIVSDEIWSDIVFTPHRHTSVASLSPEIACQTVTVFGFSKSYALAGLRMGCLLCTDADWRASLVDAADLRSTVGGAASLSQVAAVAALQEAQPWLGTFVQHLQDQRDYALERIARWPGVSVFAPQGTYVLFPDVRALGDAKDLCGRIRQEAGVALVPGATRWFGPGAQGHLRISFATTRTTLEEAFDRLDAFFGVTAFPGATSTSW